MTVTVDFTPATSSSGGTRRLTVFFDSRQLSLTFHPAGYTESSCGPGCVVSDFSTNTGPGANEIVLVYRALADETIEGTDPSPTMVTVAHTDYTDSNGLSEPAHERTFSINVNHLPASLIEPTLFSLYPEFASANLRFRLGYQPTADVTVSITASDTDLLLITGSPLTFTASDWNAPQDIRFQFIEDSILNIGNRQTDVTYEVFSSDSNYAALEPTTRTVMVLNTDTAQLNLSTPLPDLPENGFAEVTVTLLTAVEGPMSQVTVGVRSLDTSVATLSAPTVRLTLTTPLDTGVVTVFGVDNEAVHVPVPVANVKYNMEVDVLGGPSEFLSLGETRIGDIIDDDTPGLALAPPTLPDLEEDDRVTVDVMLQSKPVANVSVTISTSDSTELSFNPMTLVFTTTDWNVAQEVTFAGQPDNVADGDQPVTVTYDMSSSGDLVYDSVPSVFLSGMVLDIDDPGLTLGDLDGSYSEGQGIDHSFELATQPTADVTVTVTIPGARFTESGTGSRELTFTDSNWNTRQTVRFRVRRNNIVESAPRVVVITYGLSSDDGGYSGIGPFTQTISVANVEIPDYSFSTSLPKVPEGGSLAVNLQFLKGADAPVTLAVWSDDTAVLTLSAATVTLTVQSTGDSRVVTLFGVDNDVAFDDDGGSLFGPSFAVSVSVVAGPPPFVASAPKGLDGFVLDDDTASLVLVPPTIQNLAEGESLTVNVMLGSQPTLAVNVAIGASGASLLGITPTNLTFIAADWNTAQPVTLEATTDGVVDGSKPVTLTYDYSSSDAVYNRLSNVTQPLVITDVEVAGFAGVPTALPLLVENGGATAGGRVTVTVRLLAAAESNVTISITNLFPSVATLFSPTPLLATLISTTDGVTITFGAVDDSSINTQLEYGFKVSVVSGPGGYDGLELSVTGRVLDDERPDLLLDPSTVPNVPEGGNTEVTLRLTHLPAAAVTVAVSSNDTGELAVSSARFDFTPSNWNVDQTLTLTGMPDDLVDDAQTVEVTYSATSSDSNYTLNVIQLVTVTDVDTGSLITVPPSEPQPALPTIREDGGSATVTLRLGTATEVGVTMVFTNAGQSAATLSPVRILARLTTLADRVTVTIGAVNNDFASTSQPYALSVSVTGGPGNYPGLFVVLVGSVEDDDTAGLTVSPSTATPLPDLAEGDTTEVLVKLGTQPASAVNVAVSSSDPGELSVSPAQLTFLFGDWDTNQTVTLSGVVDNVVDGLKQVTVTYDLSSSDPFYTTVSDVTHTLDITDTQVAGFVGIPDSLPDINEVDGTATLTLSLLTAADPGVTLVISNPLPAAAALTGSSLNVMLTTTTDSATVTLSAIDDSATGDKDYALNVSVVAGPGGYAGLTVSVTGTVVDDDIPALVLVPSSLTDLQEGSKSTVSVRLSILPSADVVVAVSPSDVTELFVSSASAQLTFTTTDWSVPKEVVLTGVTDSLVDGPQAVAVIYTLSSTDPNYTGVAPRRQPLEVTDADIATLVSTPPTTIPIIDESGGSVIVSLQLGTSAASPVTLELWSSDTLAVTLSQATVTLELRSASEEGLVTVGAVDNNAATGLLPYALMVSVTGGPGGYPGLTRNVNGTVRDNDVPNLVLDPSSATLPALAEGRSSQVMVNLATQPTADVLVAVSSSDADELFVSPSQLVFTTSNWNTPRVVLLRGVTDREIDGTKTETVTYSVTSSDSRYNLPARTHSLAVTDADVAGFVLRPISLPDINENGGTATVTVSLETAAGLGVGVTVRFTAPFPTAAGLSPATILATLTTTTDRALVTLTAVNNSDLSGNQPYALNLAVVSGPGSYAGLVRTVTGTVLDDDIPNLQLTPSSALDLSEGGMTQVMVRLATRPASNVTVAVSSSDSLELAVSPAEIVFTDSDWNTAQPVLLSAVVDSDVDGTQTVTVTYAVLSLDTDYDNLPDVTQDLVVSDLDVAGLMSIPTTLPTIPENGGTAAVVLHLMTAAEAGVTLSFTSQFTSATLSSTPLLATLATLGDRTTVTLGAVDDSSDTGDRPYALEVLVTGPGGYDGLVLLVTGTVEDDDEANLVLDPSSPTLPAVAEGEETRVMVRLATQPLANVNVAISSDVDDTELLVFPANLVFTASNWNRARPVALVGVADRNIDGTQQVMVTYDLSSSDTAYDDLMDVTQSLDVTDSDVAGFVLTPDPLPDINENDGTAAGTATVTVSLATNAQPGVTLVITSPGPFATLSANAITVMLTTADDSATITLGAVDDTSDNGDQPYALKLSVFAGPVSYAGLERTFTGTVVDDDVPNLILVPAFLESLAEGDTSQVMVNLATQPLANVTVEVSSSDDDELTVSTSQLVLTLTLVFTTANWDTPQPMTLTGVADREVDGSQTVMVTYAVSSSDTIYSNLPPRIQTQEVTDTDVGGLALVPAAAELPLLSEPFGMATVTLRLAASSPSPVTLAVWSSNSLVATLSAAMVTLELMSETDRGEVAVGVVDDSFATGERTYELRVSVLNRDGGFVGLTLSVPGMVLDDDDASVRFIPAALPSIDEGGSLTVSVALGAPPTAPVTLEVSSLNPLVAMLSPATVAITLDAMRLSAPVTISGVINSELADQAYELTVSVVGSASDYMGQDASARGNVVSDESVLVVNLSELGNNISRAAGLVTVELRLGANPEMEVTVNIVNINTVGATLLGPTQNPTFTLNNMNDIVTVTLMAVNDGGAYPRSIGLEVTVTTDNPDDAAFNFFLRLSGTVQDTGPADDSIMLYIAITDLVAAGLAIDLVTDHINGGAADGPRAQIGGRSVSGLSASGGLPPSQSPDSWSDSDPWNETDDAAWKDGMELFSDSGFVLPLSSGARPGAGTEFWGGVRYSDVSGEPALKGVRHAYDGDAAAVHVGVTRRFSSGGGAGFSVGHSWVDLEVKAADENVVEKARRRLLSVHPYISVALFPETRLLLMAGYGEGKYSSERGGSVKASTRMATGRLEQDWQLGGVDLSGKLGVLSVESEVEKPDGALRGGSLQSRVELEFSKSYAPGEGMSVRPYGSLGYLHESGTVDEEGGMEVGAGLQSTFDAGLDADISARYQLDGAKRSEHNLKGRLSFDWARDRRGLLLDASQEHSLSEEKDGRASLASEYTVRLGHGWGRTLWRRHGVLGAYVSTVEGSGGDVFHGPRLGLSFEAMSLELVAEQGLSEGRLHLNYVSNF